MKKKNNNDNDDFFGHSEEVYNAKVKFEKIKAALEKIKREPKSEQGNNK